MTPFKSISLFYRLFLAFFLSSLLLVGLTGWIYLNYAEESIDSLVRLETETAFNDARKQFEQTYAQGLGGDLRLMETMPALNSLLSGNPLENEIIRQEIERQFLQTIKTRQPLYQEIEFVDAYGKVHAHVRNGRRIRSLDSIIEIAQASPRQLGEKALFERLKQSVPHTILSAGPYRDKQGKYYFVAGIAKREPEIGGFGGALIITVSLEPFIENYRRIRVFSRNIGWLYSADGALIASPYVNEAHPKEEYPHTGRQPYRVQGVCSFGDDHATLLKLEFLFPVDAFSDLLRPVLERAYQAIIIILFISVAVGYLLSRQIAKPISALVVTTKLIQMGQLDARYQVTTGGEIGKLGLTFNQMAEKLGHLIQDLEAHKKTLEAQVSKRTEALAAEIEERKQAQNNAARKGAVLTCIDGLREHFIVEPDPFELFPAFLEQLLELTQSEYGLVGDVLTDEADGTTYLKLYGLSNLAWDEATRKLYEEYRRRGLEFRKLDNLFGRVVTTGQPVFSNDAGKDPRGAGFPTGHPKISCFLGIPIYFGDKLVGEVGLANRRGGYNQAFLDWISPAIAALGQIIVARWDREARQKVEQQLQLLATTDTLTGLGNRRVFSERLALIMTRMARYPEDTALMMIDIDHFKSVNDRFGHNAGDRLLVDLVQLIQQGIREMDLFVRWGGEEFLLLMPHTSLDESLAIAERIRRLTERHAFDHPEHITISIGLTLLYENDTAETLVKRADDALYEAKTSGRNRVATNPAETRTQWVLRRR